MKISDMSNIIYDDFGFINEKSDLRTFVEDIEYTSMKKLLDIGMIDAIDSHIKYVAETIGSCFVIIDDNVAETLFKDLKGWKDCYDIRSADTICKIYNKRCFKADIVAAVCIPGTDDERIFISDIFGTYNPKTNTYNVYKGFIFPGSGLKFYEGIQAIKEAAVARHIANRNIPQPGEPMPGADIRFKYGIRINW